MPLVGGTATYSDEVYAPGECGVYTSSEGIVDDYAFWVTNSTGVTEEGDPGSHSGSFAVTAYQNYTVVASGGAIITVTFPYSYGPPVAHTTNCTATAYGNGTVSVTDNPKNFGGFSATPQPQNGGTVSSITYSLTWYNTAVIMFFSDTGTATTTNSNALVEAVVNTNIALAQIPWTPKQLGTSLSLWLDASNISSLVRSGLNVSQWRDLSGQGNNLIAPPAFQPGYLSHGLNNRPTVNFATAGSYLSGAAAFGVSGAAPRAMAAVMNGGLIATGTPATDGAFGFIVTPAGEAWVPYFYSDGIYASNSAYATSSILFAQFGNGTGSGYVNGALLGTINITPNTGPGPIQLGCRSDGYTQTGRISEVIYLSTQLDLPTQQKLEGYLAWKWGLQGTLPSSHPYYLSAPVVLVPRPAVTAAWQPGNGFQMRLSTSPGWLFIVQCTTNLADPSGWNPIGTNAADASGNWTFTDTNTAGQGPRFYRTVLNLQ